jgi:hypothetical protein
MEEQLSLVSKKGKNGDRKLSVDENLFIFPMNKIMIHYQKKKDGKKNSNCRHYPLIYIT